MVSLFNYAHPTDEGRTVSMQDLDNVDGSGVKSVRSVESIEKRAVKAFAKYLSHDVGCVYEKTTPAWLSKRTLTRKLRI